MSDFLLGGWSEDLKAQPPAEFSYTMYGMVTNLAGLTTGTPAKPGWSPKNTPAPSGPGKVMWTYGGEGSTPANMPQSSDIDNIVNATNAEHWDGVDFDDENGMNADNIVAAMKSLVGLENSYTFLAGWDYNNPGSSDTGKAINASVQHIAAEGACNRFVLMCYSDQMWNMNDINANVGPAITRTINYVGDAKKVFLALTPAGLNQQNLNAFLTQVTQKNIGGLYVWDYPALSAADLESIVTTLGIGTTV